MRSSCRIIKELGQIKYTIIVTEEKKESLVIKIPIEVIKVVAEVIKKVISGK